MNPPPPLGTRMMMVMLVRVVGLFLPILTMFPTLHGTLNTSSRTFRPGITPYQNDQLLQLVFSN